MEVAECASSNANSCLNGGNCVTNANGIYVCACVDGKGGARCEKGKKDFEVVLCSWKRKSRILLHHHYSGFFKIHAQLASRRICYLL